MVYNSGGGGSVAMVHDYNGWHKRQWLYMVAVVVVMLRSGGCDAMVVILVV